MNLSWTGSTDAGGVTGYEIERCQGAGCTNFTLLKTVTTTTTSDTGLTAQHHLQLPRPRQRRHPQLQRLQQHRHRHHPRRGRYDAADGSERSLATAAGTTVNLSWTGSTDAGGVTGYEVERCQGAGCTNFTLLKTVTTTTTSDTGLAAQHHLQLPRPRQRRHPQLQRLQQHRHRHHPRRRPIRHRRPTRALSARPRPGRR